MLDEDYCLSQSLHCSIFTRPGSFSSSPRAGRQALLADSGQTVFGSKTSSISLNLGYDCVNSILVEFELHSVHWKPLDMNTLFPSVDRLVWQPCQPVPHPDKNCEPHIHVKSYGHLSLTLYGALRWFNIMWNIILIFIKCYLINTMMSF